MVKYPQTIHWQQAMNCLSVFDNFVGLVLKGLRLIHFDILLAIYNDRSSNDRSSSIIWNSCSEKRLSWIHFQCILAFKPAILLKKDSIACAFPVNFRIFFRAEYYRTLAECHVSGHQSSEWIRERKLNNSL